MPADTWLAALSLTLVLAVAARFAKAFDTGGAVAGALVGAALSIGHGLPGVAALAAFVVVGSAATRIGYARKSAEGTAERGGGARGGARVIGKGGVAALAALLPLGALGGAAVAGALAAALADTLGTEIGTLSRGTPRVPPSFRRAERGTPGAVSILGVAAGAIGAGVVAVVAGAGALIAWSAVVAVVAAGVIAALLESVVTGAVPGMARAPGWTRNLLTTGAGAALGAAAAGGLG